MSGLFVLMTDSTVGLETFVPFIPYEHITDGTVPLLFTHGLFSYLVYLVLVETRTAPELSIT